MTEGSLWVYGRTDLAEYYRETLTLRQVWVRLKTLPPETPFWAEMEAERERAKHRNTASDLASLLDSFKP